MDIGTEVDQGLIKTEQEVRDYFKGLKSEKTQQEVLLDFTTERELTRKYEGSDSPDNEVADKLLDARDTIINRMADSADYREEFHRVKDLWARLTFVYGERARVSGVEPHGAALVFRGILENAGKS